MHFGTKSWSKMVVRWRCADLSMESWRNVCVANASSPVHYVAIDDLLITTPLKKNDISALWSCSGKAGASLLGQDVVTSLLRLCMAKWLRKWRRGWLYVRPNTKNAKSLILQRCIRIDHSHSVLIIGDLGHLPEFADQISGRQILVNALTRSDRRNQYNMRMVYKYA